MDLRQAAIDVRENAYAPYSGFKVGAAFVAGSGTVYVGCNVENAAYPEGTCAEAGAIAAMVAAGETTLREADEALYLKLIRLMRAADLRYWQTMPTGAEVRAAVGRRRSPLRARARWCSSGTWRGAIRSMGTGSPTPRG